MKEVRVFKLQNNKEPFNDWIQSLPLDVKNIIDAYISRIRLGGGQKNVRNLGDSVFEIKINHGPGYRVYFSYDGNIVILLLIGGNKSTQSKDIKKAKIYWRLYAQK